MSGPDRQIKCCQYPPPGSSSEAWEPCSVFSPRLILCIQGTASRGGPVWDLILSFASTAMTFFGDGDFGSNTVEEMRWSKLAWTQAKDPQISSLTLLGGHASGLQGDCDSGECPENKPHCRPCFIKPQLKRCKL